MTNSYFDNPSSIFGSIKKCGSSVIAMFKILAKSGRNIIVWLQREIFARVKQRIDPEHVGSLRIFQVLTDGKKLLFKKKKKNFLQ